jgi:xanthine dehydrogenase YagS FAD-binding subunit
LQAKFFGPFVTPEQHITRENSIGVDELITEVSVPLGGAGTRPVYLKQGEKESFDWPIFETLVRRAIPGAAAVS